jgi:hypothetical protein
MTTAIKATAMMALVNMLLCFACGAGVADGSIDGAADDSSVGVEEAESVGLEVGDGDGDAAATGTSGVTAPAAKAAEATGLNARIAAMTPAATAGARLQTSLLQLLGFIVGLFKDAIPDPKTP